MVDLKHKWCHIDDTWKDLGEALCGNIPVTARPAWAANVLAVVLDTLPLVATPDIEEAIEVASDSARWPDAKKVFNRLRQEVLDIQRRQRDGTATPRDDVEISVLLLAELAMKVSYSASDPIDPFDADAGWWVPTVLYDIVWTSFRPGFHERAWEALHAGHPG